MKFKAEAELTAAERMIAAAASPEAKEQAEGVKAKVSARIDELEAELVVGKSDLQPKLDAVTVAREAAVAADRARVAAADATRKATRDLEPVSVLISRKTQRLDVREPFSPIGDPGHRSGCRPSNRYVYLHRNGTRRHPYTMEPRIVG